MGVRTETIRQRMAEHMSEIEYKAWLHRDHPALGGETPYALMARGEAETVHTLIDRMDAGEIV